MSRTTFFAAPAARTQRAAMRCTAVVAVKCVKPTKKAALPPI